MKRLLDIFLSAIAILLLLPAFAIIAVAIKLSGDGPVIFRQKRAGKNGKPFIFYKFRTMDVATDPFGPSPKSGDDPRLTKIGRFLREYSLDELPQLFNVLAGHMSLVGPRPSPFRENQICVPWRRARLSVRPGITGLWQVCRDDDRSRGGFHEWIYYDITYVRHFSVWLDFKIVVATFATLGGRWRVPLSWLARTEDRARSQALSFAAEPRMVGRQAGTLVASGAAS